jgi:hypothetical protein
VLVPRTVSIYIFEHEIISAMSASIAMIVTVFFILRTVRIVVMFHFVLHVSVVRIVFDV